MIISSKILILLSFFFYVIDIISYSTCVLATELSHLQLRTVKKGQCFQQTVGMDSSLAYFLSIIKYVMLMLRLLANYKNKGKA